MKTNLDNTQWQQVTQSLMFIDSSKAAPSGCSQKAPLLLTVLEEYLRQKEEILREALALNEFSRWNLLLELDFASEVLNSERANLTEQVSVFALNPEFEFRDEVFIEAVRGLTRLGKNLFESFLRKRSRERAVQLLSWLNNSGDSVVLYARAALRPRSFVQVR